MTRELAVVVVVLALVLVLSRTASAATPGSARRASFTAFAESIAVAEGYGIAGAIPTVRNNPGDLKLSGDTITTFPTPDAGWQALYRQLDLIRSGDSRYYTLAMTIGQMSRVWTATEQGAWASNVVRAMNERGFAVSLSTQLAEIL
jgi:hypothetical protein